MADKELTFWDHLDELRRVLFRVLGVWFVLAVGYFIAMPWLFDNVVLAPCHNDFVFYDVLRYVGKVFDLHDDFFTQDFHVKLININLAAPFFIHMSTAFWMSVVTATPYIFFEIWRFISPALYANERRGVKKALCIGTVMFFLGVLLGYFMVYPLTLRFLSTYQLSAAIENQISLNSYIDNFMMLVLCMGLAFELPLVTWLEANPKVKWVNYCGLKSNKYYELAQKYMPNGSCGVIAFGLEGTREEAIKFMDSLKLACIVTHVADARTCVLHPASHTHRQLTDEQLIEAGVAPDLIRLSVGIENVNDIIADLEQAMAQV